MLHYRGVSFAFHVPEQFHRHFRGTVSSSTLEFPDGSSPVAARMFIYHGRSLLEPVVPWYPMDSGRQGTPVLLSTPSAGSALPGLEHTTTGSTTSNTTEQGMTAGAGTSIDLETGSTRSRRPAVPRAVCGDLLTKAAADTATAGAGECVVQVPAPVQPGRSVSPIPLSMRTVRLLGRSSPYERVAGLIVNAAVSYRWTREATGATRRLRREVRLWLSADTTDAVAVALIAGDADHNCEALRCPPGPQVDSATISHPPPTVRHVSGGSGESDDSDEVHGTRRVGSATVHEDTGENPFDKLSDDGRGSTGRPSSAATPPRHPPHTPSTSADLNALGLLRIGSTLHDVLMCLGSPAKVTPRASVDSQLLIHRMQRGDVPLLLGGEKESVEEMEGGEGGKGGAELSEKASSLMDDVLQAARGSGEYFMTYPGFGIDLLMSGSSGMMDHLGGPAAVAAGHEDGHSGAGSKSGLSHPSDGVVGGVHHLSKIVLHTNTPQRPDFHQYRKACFHLYVEDCALASQLDSVTLSADESAEIVSPDQSLRVRRIDADMPVRAEKRRYSQSAHDRGIQCFYGTRCNTHCIVLLIHAFGCVCCSGRPSPTSWETQARRWYRWIRQHQVDSTLATCMLTTGLSSKPTLMAPSPV